MVGSVVPGYFVKPSGERSFTVWKRGFRGGLDQIATYNYENQADEVAGFLNRWAKSEVLGARKSGTGRKQD